MRITQRLLSTEKKARAGIKFTKPVKMIVIHWIGPYPAQQVTAPWNWWENGSDGRGVLASAHFIVKDENILQAVPLNEVAWHAGDERNYESIGIEVIPMNTTGEFSQQSIDTLRELIRHIKKETGRELTIERHFDGKQKKDCPRFYTSLSDDAQGDKRWEALKQYWEKEIQ